MRAYNMVNTAGYFAINTGGKVTAFNDPGRTKEVVWTERPEQNWQRKEREMTERARNYLPNVRESALERELWNQVTGDNRTASNVSPRLAAEYSAYQSKLKREDLISKQLFDQINAH